MDNFRSLFLPLLLLALLSPRVHAQETGSTNGTTLGSTSQASASTSTGSQDPATTYEVFPSTSTDVPPSDRFQSQPTSTSIQPAESQSSRSQPQATATGDTSQPQPFPTSITLDRSFPFSTTILQGDKTQSTSPGIVAANTTESTATSIVPGDGTQSASAIIVTGDGSQTTSSSTDDGSQSTSFPVVTGARFETPSSTGDGIQSASTTVVPGNGRPLSSYRTVLLGSGSLQTSTTVQPDTQPTSTTVDGSQSKTTTVLPDVTATSQTIVLLTEKSNKSLTEPNTVTAPTSILPLDNVTENATNSEFKNFLLTFNGSCGQLALSVVKQLNDLLAPNGTEVFSAPTDCVAQFQLRLLVSESVPLTGLMGSTTVSLAGDAPVLLIGIEELRDEDITSDSEDTFYFLTAPLTNREIVAYSIVGAVFGLAVVLVSVLLCCKCCCARGGRKASRNIPRLAMRLEDYSLTRIPRPSTIFASRNGNAEMGRRQIADPEQSFETSVVPLDDDFGSVRQNRLRSFDGRRPRTEVQHHSGSGSPARYGSNERLARESNGNRLQGTDNRVFRF